MKEIKGNQGKGNQGNQGKAESKTYPSSQVEILIVQEDDCKRNQQQDKVHPNKIC